MYLTSLPAFVVMMPAVSSSAAPARNIAIRSHVLGSKPPAALPAEDGTAAAVAGATLAPLPPRARRALGRKRRYAPLVYVAHGFHLRPPLLTTYAACALFCGTYSQLNVHVGCATLCTLCMICQSPVALLIGL